MEIKNKIYHEFKITLDDLKAMLIASGVVIPTGAQYHVYQPGEQNTVMFVAIEDIV
jgi:hypothetical protein